VSLSSDAIYATATAAAAGALPEMPLNEIVFVKINVHNKAGKAKNNKHDIVIIMGLSGWVCAGGFWILDSGGHTYVTDFDEIFVWSSSVLGVKCGLGLVIIARVVNGKRLRDEQP